MSQITLRLPDDLAERLKQEASRHGKSLNAWIMWIVETTLDPNLGGTERERLRERLRAAGVLAPIAHRPRRRQDPAAVARARAEAAGRGKPLSRVVSEDRD